MTRAVTAFQGVGMDLHRSEGATLAQIIYSPGQGTLRAILESSDPDYQTDLQDAILRAAEIITALRRKPTKHRK